MLFNLSEMGFHDQFDFWLQAKNHSKITCEVLTATQLLCKGTTFDREQRDVPGTNRFYIDIGVCVFMVLFAGICSGLTLGLLSLDPMNLEVILKGGSPTQRAHAQRIMPLVRNHHLLLCTLLLANAAAMEGLPIFLDRLVGPILAIVFSVTAVLIFGEVLPQAVCSRYGLAIGAGLSWFVWALIALLSPIAWPLSKALDCMLGKSHGSYYKRAELRELVGLHSARHWRTEDLEAGAASSHRAQGEGGEEEGEYEGERGDGCVLTAEEANIIRGALDMRDKRVKEAMTPLARVFSLPMTDKLNAFTVERILASGHSRVPVYRSSPDTILGVMMVKQLIRYDLQKGIPIMGLNLVPVPHIPADMRLSEALSLFRGGKSHLAVVISEQDHMTVLGIVTLEDVLEELLQVEIVDETDVYVDVARGVRVARAALVRMPSFPKLGGSTHTHGHQHTLPAPAPTNGNHGRSASDISAWPTTVSLAAAASSPEKHPQAVALHRSISHPASLGSVLQQQAAQNVGRGTVVVAGDGSARTELGVEAITAVKQLVRAAGADGGSFKDRTIPGGVVVGGGSGGGDGGGVPEHGGVPPGKGTAVNLARVAAAVRSSGSPTRRSAGAAPSDGVGGGATAGGGIP
eukprot:jgi/Mesvir1/3675/Mv14964-RA.1